MHIPEGDTEQIWQESDHNWNSLESWLKSHKDTSSGIDDTLIDHMIQTAHQKQQSGSGFPQSKNELNKVMNGSG